MRRTLLIIACFAVVSTLTATRAAAQTKPAAAAPPSDMTAGRRMFDAQCAWCHGNGGDGGTGPNLHGTLRHATTLTSISDIVINGIPGIDMPSFRLGLTERAARQAATYVISLSRSGGRPGPGNVHALQKSELARVDRELESTLMPSYESRLSAAQLDDLVTYLATLRGVK